MRHIGAAFVAIGLVIVSVILIDSAMSDKPNPAGSSPERSGLFDEEDEPDASTQQFFLPAWSADRSTRRFPRLPETIIFAGERVPLDDQFVRRRVEREFYEFLNAGDSIITAKRTGRCFPPVEKRLAESGMPDDLKFLLIVESQCVESAVSPANAAGPWQFMQATGTRYALNINEWKDERHDLHLSTEAAIKYLDDLKAKYFATWPLSIAAYNLGERRVRQAILKQNVNDYWKLSLPRETMRYVPRVIAAKEIFTHYEKYFGLSKEDLWDPLEFHEVSVNVWTTRRALSDIAKDHGTHVLYLKQLNPSLRRSYLPQGTHAIRIPAAAPSKI